MNVSSVGTGKKLTGSVVNSSSEKTITVKVERKVKHPLYGKYIRRSKKYHVHDEKNAGQVGDVVTIAETVPISKLKTWKLLEIVAREGNSG